MARSISIPEIPRDEITPDALREILIALKQFVDLRETTIAPNADERSILGDEFDNKVLLKQQKIAIKTSVFSATGATLGTWEKTGLKVTITPAAERNIVIVTGRASLGSNSAATGAVRWRIVRDDSVAVFVGDAAGSRLRASGMAEISNTGHLQDVPLWAFDVPRKKTQVVYELQIMGTLTGAIYLNRTHTDSDTNVFTRSSSIIIAREYKPFTIRELA